VEIDMAAYLQEEGVRTEKSAYLQEKGVSTEKSMDDHL